MSQITPEQRQQILDCLKNRQKIQAIKIVREAMGSDLGEAKEFVESVQKTLATSELQPEANAAVQETFRLMFTVKSLS